MTRVRALKYVWIAVVLLIVAVAGYFLTEHYITWKDSGPEFNAAGEPTKTAAGAGPTAGLLGRPMDTILTDEIKTVRVSTVEELFAAIGSNTFIELEGGVYDITEFLNKLWTEDSQFTTRVHHSFGYLRNHFDKPEVIIWPFYNLTIKGSTDPAQQETYLYADINNIEANVLTFSHCDTVTLSDLHIQLNVNQTNSSVLDEKDSCGNLLVFDSCSNVTLNNIEFGGPSRYLLNVTSGDGIYWIEDCNFFVGHYGNLAKGIQFGDGAFSVTNSKASFNFLNCMFRGDSENVFSSNFPTAEMHFEGCEINQWSAAKWLERDNVLFSACTLDGQPLETDLDARAARFDPSPYWTAFFDESDLNNTKWRGILMQYTDTAASRALPYTDLDSGFVYEVNCTFNDDGTGMFEWYNAPEAGPFVWHTVTMKEASFPGVTVELFEKSDGSDRVMRLWIDNVMIWMEPAE